jgi:hypothetical protein
MGIRIDNDLDFQHWYYENYNDVTSVVSHEIYNEYLIYKEQQKIRIILIISILLEVFCVIGQIVLILLRLKMI